MHVPFTAGGWHPASGDPTVAGWMLTAGYLITATCCLLAGRKEQFTAGGGTAGRPWWWIAAFSGFLGINKQLDLHTLLIEWGRALAAGGGWFEDRRLVEKWVFSAAGIVFVAMLALWIRRHRRFMESHWLLLSGVAMILVWCALRAAGILHVLHRIDSHSRAFHWISLIEAAGVSMMLLGAGISRKTRSNTGST